MPGISRTKQLIELCGVSAQAGTNVQVRQLLELQSAEESNAIITATFVPIQATVDSVEGRQDAVEARQDAVEMLVATMSGDVADLTTDFYNLDLSVNDQLDTFFDTTTTTAISGAYALPAGAEGFITIVVNGVNKKIAYFGE